MSHTVGLCIKGGLHWKPLPCRSFTSLLKMAHIPYNSCTRLCIICSIWVICLCTWMVPGLSQTRANHYLATCSGCVSAFFTSFYCNRRNFCTRFNFVFFFFVLLAEDTKFSSIRKPCMNTSVCDMTPLYENFCDYSINSVLQLQVLLKISRLNKVVIFLTSDKSLSLMCNFQMKFLFLKSNSFLFFSDNDVN